MSMLSSEVQRQLLACQYSAWLPSFTQQTFRSRVIDLPNEFVEYLHEDGIIVGDASGALPRRAQPSTTIVDEDDYQDWSDEGEVDSASDWGARFPELHQAVTNSIEQLGGSVIPRLNWSTPTDALWISQSNSLMCTNADQVLLLLKSSDRVSHDLELLQQMAASHRTSSADTRQSAADAPSAAASPAASSAPRAQLVLRRWQELRPEREFRCFVHNHALVAISQRDPSQYFPQLAGEAASIRAVICTFHEELVGIRFALSSYAMDVYVSPAGAVRIVDINPIIDTTSALLFAWDELPYAAASSTPAPPAGVVQNGQEALTAANKLQRRRQEHAQEAMRHQAAGSNGYHVNGNGEPSDSSSDEAGSETDSEDDDQVPFRIVEQASLVQPGQRMVCGMPFDMLNLQDSMDDMMQLMAQRQAES